MAYSPKPPEQDCSGKRGLRWLLCWLRKMWRYGFADGIRDVYDDVRGADDRYFEDHYGPGVDGMAGGWIQDVIDAEWTPDELDNLLREAQGYKWPLNGIVVGVYVLSYLLNTMGVRAMVGESPALHKLNKVLSPARPDPTVAWMMVFRDAIGRAALGEYLAEQGWDDKLIAGFEEVARRIPDLGVLLELAQRGEISDIDMDVALGKQGYTPENAAHLVKLIEAIPGPSDLVTMGGREAWNEEAIARYGTDHEIPAEMVDWLEKQGLSSDWARRYWIAHWRLPMFSQAREFLWRTDFDASDLDALLKFADYPPTVRQWFAKIAYRTLTRVDIRRMHKTGVLSYDDVLAEYLKFGYDQTNAKRMADFTVLFNQSDDREATKADILGGLDDGVLSPAEAQGWLQEIGYSSDVAAYLVAREQAQAERDRIDHQLELIEDLYVNGDISEAQARQQMAALNLASSEIDTHLDLWRIDREARIKRPTRAQMDKFLLRDIVTQGDYTQVLADTGYQDRYVGWYLDAVLADKAQDAADAERDARKERQDIADRRIKSDYQITKARLDVDVAELRTAIAEQQQAIRARRRRYERDVRLAREALTAAQLQRQAELDIEDLEARIDENRSAIDTLHTAIETGELEVAGLREQLAAQRAVSAPPIGEKEAQIATLEREIDAERTAIEAVETTIARLEREVGGEVTEERAEAIAEEILDLNVEIEEHQDTIAGLREDIGAIEAEIESLRVPGEDTAARIATLRREAEAHRVDVRTAEATIATLEAAIRERRVRLERDLRVIERLEALDVIEASYLKDEETLESKLEDLRVNLRELIESRASLRVGYREALAPE